MADVLCACGCGNPTTVHRGQVRKFVHGHNGRKPIRYQVEDRGYSTPCWIWCLRKTPGGYGNFGRAAVSAHRWYYEQYVGPIPPGLVVDHLCHVPSCVNPEHLEPVTQAENVRRSRSAKLTYDAVGQIRNLSEAGKTQQQVAEMFGVDRSHISRILSGDRGAWV